ncbi:MAG: zinc ribbon domain-containing protein [Candidatus Marinimicrobia bacterium]|nr:zinc ribbon domain-containing protein [Candidatus Neomarinimicrobiota bacterium]
MFIIRLTIMLMVLPSATVSFAQEKNISISKLAISLWPEYDNSQVLVMYRGSVSGDVQLPAEIHFNILPGTIDPHVASVTLTDAHIHDPFEVKVDDKGTYVSFVLKERNFHLEYYFNPFTPGVNDKAFSFSYKTYYPVSNFSYEVQQPVGAFDFKTTPISFQEFTDEKGITHSQVSAGSLAAGETKNVSVSYYRSSSETSLQKLEKSEKSTDIYTLISIGVLILLVGIMIYSYFGKSAKKRSKVQRAGAKRKTHTAHTKANEPTEKLVYRSENVPNFCSNCGEKVDTDAVFCGSCGIQILSK